MAKKKKKSVTKKKTVVKKRPVVMGQQPVITRVASIPTSLPMEERLRIKVCDDGDKGPYVLCDSKDLTKVRIFLQKLDTSFNVTAITDGLSKSGKAMGSLVNIPEGTDLKALQDALDKAFPYTQDWGEDM